MGEVILLAVQCAFVILLGWGAFLAGARRDRRGKAADRRQAVRGGRRKGETTANGTHCGPVSISRAR
jgi:hypothetical protein